MANTYTQLLVQIVFAVKGRENLIAKNQRETLHKYITGVLQKDKQKMLAIFCMPDHLHFLVGLNPDISIADMVLDVKRASTNYINENGIVSNHFNWQKGYGAFSYSKSQLPNIVNYILNQESHHQKKSFREEYSDFLKRFEVEHDEKYLFEFYE